MRYLIDCFSRNVIVIVIFLSLLNCVSCSNKESDTDKKSFIDDIALSGEVTCISKSINGESLYLGMLEDYFIEYNIKHRTQVKYELPDELNKIKTYQVFELSNQGEFKEFIISKRNNGMLYVRYHNYHDSDYLYHIDSYVYLTSEVSGDSMPKKGINYSAYKILSKKDSVLFIGSSNGLMNIDYLLLDSIRTTSKNQMEIPYNKALRELRQNKNQFAIENIIADKDFTKIIAVTDSGIYRMSADITNMAYDKLVDGRFWSATIHGDTLEAVFSDRKGNYKKIEVINPYGSQPIISNAESTDVYRLIEPNIYLYLDGMIGINGRRYDLGLNYVGPESIELIGNQIFYQSEKGFKKVNLDLLNIVEEISYTSLITSLAGDETLYLITDSGLYEFYDKDYKFLGYIENIPNIKDSVWFNGYIYVCDDLNIYRLSVNDGIFSSCRSFEEVECVSILSPDRIESLSKASEGLYIGTRNGLYLLKNDETLQEISVTRNFMSDSPYLTNIVADSKYVFASSLNQGLLIIGNEVSILDVFRNISDIQSLDLKDERLLINTKSSVIIIDALTHSMICSVDIENIKDAKLLSRDSLCVLTDDSIVQYCIEGNMCKKLSSKPNKYYYKHVVVINDQVYYISEQSIVNDVQVIMTGLSWDEVILYIIGILILFVVVGSFIIYIIRLHRQYRQKEYALALSFERSDVYKSAAIQLIENVDIIRQNLNLYDEMTPDLDILAGCFDRFEKQVSPLLCEKLNTDISKQIEEHYNILYEDVGLWFKQPQNSDDKEFRRWINKCRYGFQLLNIYNKKGIKLLIENPNDLADVEFEIEKAYTWELFVRFTLCNEKLETIISSIILEQEIQDSKHGLSNSALRKKLKERVDHKNVGPIPNLLIRNLSRDIWKSGAKMIANKPYDVVWIACAINCNDNGLNDRLEYASSKKLVQ